MDLVVAVVLAVLYAIIWGVILWSDHKWRTQKDERQARWRYEENDEYDYGHNVKYYSKDED